MAKKKAKTKTASELTKRNTGKKRIGIGQTREMLSDLADIISEEIRVLGMSPTADEIDEMVVKRVNKFIKANTQ